jgi:SAM-dependent methyltransferase
MLQICCKFIIVTGLVGVGWSFLHPRCLSQTHRHIFTSQQIIFATTTEIPVADTQSSMPKAVLKVPASAWRWPPLWPFNEDSFAPYDGLYPENKELAFLPQFLNYFNENEISADLKVLAVGIPEEMAADQVGSGWTIQKSLKDNVQYPLNNFDTVVVMVGIDSITQPRETIREVWKALKPGGELFLCFMGGNGNGAVKPVKLWTTTTDEQKIWVVGSYAYYAVPEGWSSIEGYDIVGNSGDKTMVFEKMNDDASPHPFTVRAKKLDIPTFDLTQSFDDIVTQIIPRLLPVTNIDNMERKLLAMRMTSSLQGTHNCFCLLFFIYHFQP